MVLEKAIASMCVLIGGAVLVIARRWKNDPLVEPNAGASIAAFTMFIAIALWF